MTEERVRRSRGGTTHRSAATGMTRGDLEKGIAALVNKYQEENDYVVVFVSLTRVGLKNETYVTHADTALMRKRDFKSSGQPKRATDGRNNY